MNIEQFYSQVINMNTGSLHTISFRHLVHLSICKYRWTKNDLAGAKSFRGLRESGPRARTRTTRFGEERTNHVVAAPFTACLDKKDNKTTKLFTHTALWTAGIWHRLLFCLLTSWYLQAYKSTVLTILIAICSTFTARANAFISPSQLFNLHPCFPSFPAFFATCKSI